MTDNFEKKVAVDGPVVNAGELGSSTFSPGQALPAGPLGLGQRWTVARKREVVLRLLRDEPVQLLSRQFRGPGRCGSEWRTCPGAPLCRDSPPGGTGGRGRGGPARWSSRRRTVLTCSRRSSSRSSSRLSRCFRQIGRGRPSPVLSASSFWRRSRRTGSNSVMPCANRSPFMRLTFLTRSAVRDRRSRLICRRSSCSGVGAFAMAQTWWEGPSGALYCKRTFGWAEHDGAASLFCWRLGVSIGASLTTRMNQE